MGAGPSSRQAPHVPLYPDHSGVSTFLAVFSLPGICRVVHFQLLGTLVVFLGFSRKPFRGFPMSRLGALLLFRGDIVRIIPGIASFFLGDGYLGRRRDGVVAQEQPPFYIGHLLKQPTLGVNRRLKRVQYRAKHGQQPVYSCVPVNAACAVWILACLVVGEDLPESVLRCQDLLRHIHGQIESCDFCPSETPAGSCGPKRHLGAPNRA